MAIVHVILIIMALICFFLAAFDIKIERFNLIATGLFLWALSALLMTGR